MIELKGREIIDQGDTFGDTALHYAVTRSSKVAAEILLEYGANVNLQNKQRLTPISLASKNGDLELLPILLEKGADFAIRKGLFTRILFRGTRCTVYSWNGFTGITLKGMKKEQQHFI